MSKFLLVSSRPEEELIDAEYASYQQASGLDSEHLDQITLDMMGLPEVDVTQYAGIFIGGSSYDMTTPTERKLQSQLRLETDLTRILTDIVAHNIPCLTTGFGTELATTFLGGTVTKEWAEDVQIADCTLTRAGQEDPLLKGFPWEFPVFVAHHEGVDQLPDGAVVLASTLMCPAQIMRVSPTFYATQFNPEIDTDAIAVEFAKIEDGGYSGADDVESIVTRGRAGGGSHQAGQLVRNFVAMFG